MFDLSLCSLSNSRGKKPPTLPSPTSCFFPSLAGAAVVCPSSPGAPPVSGKSWIQGAICWGIHTHHPLNDRGLNRLRSVLKVYPASLHPGHEASHGKVWKTSGRKWKLGEIASFPSLAALPNPGGNPRLLRWRWSLYH